MTVRTLSILLLSLLIVVQECAGELFGRWESGASFVVGVAVGLAVALLYASRQV